MSPRSTSGGGLRARRAARRARPRARLLLRSGANEIAIRGGGAPLATCIARRSRGRSRRSGSATAPSRSSTRAGRHGDQDLAPWSVNWQWDWRKRRADVSLNATIPWDVEVTGGANKLHGEPRQVDLRSFGMQGGADQLRLTLGQPVGVVPIRLPDGAPQPPDRATDRCRRSSCASTAAPAGSPSIGSGSAGRAARSSRRRAMQRAADRFSIDLTGGAGTDRDHRGSTDSAGRAGVARGARRTRPGSGRGSGTAPARRTWS